jgi:hypothetical protein
MVIVDNFFQILHIDHPDLLNKLMPIFRFHSSFVAFA